MNLKISYEKTPDQLDDLELAVEFKLLELHYTAYSKEIANRILERSLKKGGNNE